MQQLQSRKRKKEDQLPFSEYLYITRFTVDLFHPKIKPIVNHVKDILRETRDKRDDKLIENIIATFCKELESITKFYCRNIENKLYDQLSIQIKKDLKRLFDILDDLENDNYDEQENALQAILEIDELFYRLYNDEMSDITMKMKKIKIRKIKKDDKINNKVDELASTLSNLDI